MSIRHDTISYFYMDVYIFYSFKMPYKLNSLRKKKEVIYFDFFIK